ncbi:MAG: TrbG/VirB9 family P-type conjugative transfer protein [Rickettsiales bacterium]
MTKLIKNITLYKVEIFLFALLFSSNITFANENLLIANNIEKISIINQIDNKDKNFNINEVSMNLETSESNEKEKIDQDKNKYKDIDSKKNINIKKVKNHNKNKASNNYSGKVKTYLYKEDNIYNLDLYFGFQSHIVFDKNEEIKTISMGENYAFKINIIDNRLFIKPIEDNIHTNMTVITNKRSYEFDVKVKNENSDKSNITYLIKFLYCDTAKKY